MSDDKKICPTCEGKKVVEGVCECNMEWRGTQQGDDWQDCQCTPELPCKACSGTGFVD
ncbi:MAG: ankyrin [Thermodesulfobacteriota bacterium]